MHLGRTCVDWTVGVALLLGLGCGQEGLERRAYLRDLEAQRAVSERKPEPPPPPPAEPPPPLPEPPSYAERLAEVPNGASEQKALEVLLYSYCGECHGSDYQFRYPGGEGVGMQYVDDIDRLIETGMIIPGDAAGSKVFRRMARGEMPPVTSGLPTAPAELVERLSAFIASLPARSDQ